MNFLMKYCGGMIKFAKFVAMEMKKYGKGIC